MNFKYICCGLMFLILFIVSCCSDNLMSEAQDTDQENSPPTPLKEENNPSSPATKTSTTEMMPSAKSDALPNSAPLKSNYSLNSGSTNSGSPDQNEADCDGSSLAGSCPQHLISRNITESPEETLPDYFRECPSDLECEKLPADCLDCDFQIDCFYGRTYLTVCRAKPNITCKGDQEMSRSYICRYCYQTPHWEHHCTNSTDCRVVTAPREYYTANCTIPENLLCLGHRKFYKRLPCNWSSGKRWSTAVVLSVTLGGFGADRFYLGMWREGIGKLFSFGGLGIWTLVDVVLVATGYVGPADGSLYIF